MLTINIDLTNPEAVLVADGLAKDYVANVVADYNKSGASQTVTVGTEVLANWFRVALSDKEIDGEHIRFTSPYGDVEVESDGKYKSTPENFPTPWKDSMFALL